jgi:hypothetical protein
MAGGGVAGGVVVRNHAVSRVGVTLEGGVARSGGPPGRSQQEGDRGRSQQEGDMGKSQEEGDRGRSQGEGDRGRAQQDEESRLDAEVVSLLAKVSSKRIEDKFRICRPC